MAARTTPTAASPVRRSVIAACAFRDDDRGGRVWHLWHGNVHLLRARPASLLRKGSGDAAWRGSLHLPFELSSLLHEIELDDDVVAGRRTLASLPAALRPSRRPYRSHRREAMRRFFVDVPPAVQHALHGWGSGSYPLFRFLMTTPAALDLMDTEDGAHLAWCLANAHELRTSAAAAVDRNLLRRARSQLRRRRRDALAFVDLPTTPAALAALTRVPRAVLDAATVGDVRAVLSAPELVGRARHVPVWNHVLDVLTLELHRHVHMSFLLELSAEPPVRRGWFSTVAHELRETLAMLQRCGQRPPVFRSRAHLRDVHDDVLRRTSPLARFWSTTPFPALPIALSPRERSFLRPLADSVDLVREGREMHHCLGKLATHHALARHGLFLAFAVTRPTRLTLAFTWSARAGRWQLYDLRGPANDMACHAAFTIAHELLSRLQRAAPPACLADGGAPPALVDDASDDDDHDLVMEHADDLGFDDRGPDREHGDDPGFDDRGPGDDRDDRTDGVPF